MESPPAAEAARGTLRRLGAPATEPAAPGSSDRRDLIDEIASISAQERGQLAQAAGRIAAESARLAASQRALQGALEAVASDLAAAGRTWADLEAYVADPAQADDEVFVNVMPLCGHAIRKSAAARTALVRHTPTLRGFPASLDPGQSLATGRRTYTVDYLRGGYVLFQEPGNDPPSRYVDHPTLNAEAATTVAKMYRSSPASASLAFTCGIAALDAVMDVMAARSLKSGQLNLLGRNCWIELRRRLEIRDPRHFELYDDNHPSAAAELLLQPDVQSVWIEGIQNHPEMRVADLQALRDAALNLPEGGNKFLVVDNVATFDSDVFAMFDEPAIQDRLSVICAVSMIKFFQNGTDSAKAGLLALRLSPTAGRTHVDLIEARAGSGKAPAHEELLACGCDTPTSLAGRMRRYDRNNRRLAQRLARFAAQDGRATVGSPWLPTHPDHERALSLHGHGGRFVYLRPTRNGPDVDALWLDLYRALADGAAQRGVPLIAASTFGFALPHIHIVRHQEYGLSIRLSAGSVHADMVERFVDHLEQTITWFLADRGAPGPAGPETAC